MNEILKGIKSVIVPIIIGIITYPVLSIFQFKGLVLKDPVIIKNSLFYKVTSTSDITYKDIIITFNLSDSNFLSINDHLRMYFSPDPYDSNWVNNANARYGNPDRLSRSIIVSEIKKGNYRFVVPVFRHIGQLKQSKELPCNVVFNQNNINVPFSDVKTYQWLDWIFFNRWWAALIALLLTVLIQLIYKRFVKK